MEARMATILSVENEPMILTLVTTVLKERGHAVLAAASASEAIGLFETYPEQIDLLISDINMPGMDGICLAGTLQARDPSLRVLLVSGGYNRSQVPGQYEFLQKPFVLADLVAKVDRLCVQAVPARAAAVKASLKKSGPQLLRRGTQHVTAA
jgi:two-component system, cell cycle sensor histidine kinase and response regulator CckA